MKNINKALVACMALIILALTLLTGIYAKGDIRKGSEPTRVTTSLAPRKAQNTPFVYGEYNSNKKPDKAVKNDKRQ